MFLYYAHGGCFPQTSQKTQKKTKQLSRPYCRNVTKFRDAEVDLPSAKEIATESQKH